MEIRAAGRPERPKDHEVNKTKDDNTSIKNKDHITRHGKTRIIKTKRNQQEDKNQSKNKDQQQNSHLAWNPDSRWSR